VRRFGRPRIDVDLDLMWRLLAAGTTKAQVARQLAISRRTLYRRLAAEIGVPQLDSGALHTMVEAGDEPTAAGRGEDVAEHLRPTSGATDEGTTKEAGR
jgi:hypothetical protein